MRKAVVLLTLCAFAAAMVPQDKEYATTPPASSTSSTAKQTFCSPHTPCGWNMYKQIPNVRVFDFNIVNTYCVCSAGLACEDYEYDSATNSMVMRCRTPSEVTTEETTPTES